jgi:two-component system, LytTR family, sensor kinase
MHIDLSEEVQASRRWRWLPVWVGVAALYAAALHTQVGVPVQPALQTSTVYFLSLALLMIPVARISERLRAARRGAADVVLAHLAVGLCTVALWQGVVVAHFRLTVGPKFWEIVFDKSWMFQLLFAIAVYGTALSVTLTSQAWRRERERERREAALIVAARDAELMALKAQFQPHFVLNALNSLLALIDVNPALARTMVVRLSDLMKGVFDRIDVPHVPLERELDLVRAYLDIERIRLGARLSISYEIDDAARGVMVPPFLLQPLVENAVKHGIAPYATPGSVRVTARVEGGRVHVTVSDSGRPPAGNASDTGAPSLAPPSTGRGLQITRRRLNTVYGQSYSMTLGREGPGMAVHLDLPIDAAHVA